MPTKPEILPRLPLQLSLCSPPVPGVLSSEVRLMVAPFFSLLLHLVDLAEFEEIGKMGSQNFSTIDSIIGKLEGYGT